MSIWNHLVCKPVMSLIHKKCRITDSPYLRSKVYRFVVPDDRVKWSVEFSDYKPSNYTDPSIIGKPWADPDISDFKPKWNSIDGKTNRKSFICDYSLDKNLRPINPMGRTGLTGRGVLGKWGPNHAADPLVTRYNKLGELEFIAIQRKDTGEWAIPGGMVDAGEDVSETFKREFTEEVLDGVDDVSYLNQLWDNGYKLFEGYVDDPRNTDNAWMETTVMNFHDKNGVIKDNTLKAGDDAVAFRWVKVDSDESFYASHKHFIDLLKNQRPLKL